MNEYKTCSLCKQVKPTTDFGKHKSSKDGLYSQCLPCHRQHRAAYRQRNVESIKKQQADNYRRNREKRIAYVKEQKKLKPEKSREYNANSKKRNHIKIAADSRRRRAKLKANGIFKISKKELAKLLAKPCFYCGTKERITIDHVIAIARGGTDSIGNLVPACKSCNSQKRDLTITEWRKKREGR